MGRAHDVFECELPTNPGFVYEVFFFFSLFGSLSLDLEEETFENKKVIVCYFLARLAFFETCGKV